MPAKVANVRWKCKQCGKSRWLKPAAAREKRYCSRACHYASMTKKPEERVRKYPYAAKKVYPGYCPRCEKAFEASKGNQIYCSHECAFAAARDKYLVSSKSRRREATCENCGKPFPMRAGGTGRFCSRQCFYDSMRGEKAAHWRGGRHISGEGYVKAFAPGHPSAQSHGGYVPEHRLVMETIIGRYLRPYEYVHHKNGDRQDNRPENLELWVKRQPKGQRIADLVQWANEILADYGPLVQGKLGI